MSKSKSDPRREGVIPPPVPTPCGACSGHCCTAGFGWTGIVIQEGEDHLFPNNALSRHWDLAEGGTIFHYEFAKMNITSCMHLQNGKCAIYNKRPLACREFDCVEYYVNDSTRLFKNMKSDVFRFMHDLLTKSVKCESGT